MFGPIKNENFVDFRRDMPALTDRRNAFVLSKTNFLPLYPATVIFIYYIINATAHITAADSCESTAAGRAQADICVSYILLFFRPINGASLAVQLNYSDNDLITISTSIVQGRFLFTTF